MSKAKFRANILYGLVILIPIAVIGVILGQILGLVRSFAAFMGLDSGASAGAAILLALVLLVIICYGVGALVRTRLGAWSFERVEQKLLQHVPGYKITSRILKGFADEDMTYPPVLAQVSAPGAAVLGFVVEENENDSVTVFVPSTPAITVGKIYILSRDRVTYLDASTLDLVNCLTEWGTGSKTLIGAANLE